MKRRWSTAGDLNPARKLFAPPGSNRSSSGGNEAAEASGVEGRFRRFGKFVGRNGSERCAGPETGDAGADPLTIEGKPKPMGEYERNNLMGPAGVLATTCRQRGPDATRETPAVIANGDQPATRESQAGPCGVAERSVLPRKPGNAGGGKGPQLKGDARSGEGPRDW